MRLLRLDVEGFASFHAPATLDLSEADYFAIVGPTGAGKTTLLDAVSFALYGSVPRWPRSNQVSLGLAPSAKTARVSLIFDVGPERLVAARIISRAAGGQVTTKEARLDRLPPDIDVAGDLVEVLAQASETVAQGPDDVSAAVGDRLGLDFEYFTQCVVLPQGAFADFLHAAPRKRQDLLVALLGMDVYERVRAAAKRAESAANTDVALLEARIDDLAHATPEAEEKTRLASEQANALVQVLPAALDTLTGAERARSNEKSEVDRIQSQLRLLGAVRRPDGIEDLADRLRSLTQEQSDAADQLTKAEKAEEDAKTDVRLHGEPGSWKRVLSDWDKRDDLGRQLDVAETRLQSAKEDRDRSALDRQRRQDDQRHVRTALDEAIRADSAANLRAHLHPGDDCPVCLRPVTDVPPPSGGTADIEALQRRLDTAQQDLSLAQAAVAAGDELVVRRHTEREGLTAQVADLDARLAGQPDRATAKTSLEQAEEAKAKSEEAAAAVTAARGRLRAARGNVAALEGEIKSARSALSTARDPLVALGAPPLESGDLAEDWATLLDWVEMTRAQATGRLDEAQQLLTEAMETVELRRSAAEDLFAEHGVALPADRAALSLEYAAKNAVQQAAKHFDDVRKDRAKRATAEQERDRQAASAALANQLALRLDARHFEKWLCAEALEVLVTDASKTLLELSSGQYELAVARDDIVVVDHNDAGESRPVHTLSGGETFQAALALALALSQHVASMSAAATRSLETLLLDEGFGTLDAATLDTVAASLEQLAGGGERSVGLITHVPQLADRVPVQFAVTRDSAGSHVERIER